MSAFKILKFPLHGGPMLQFGGRGGLSEFIYCMGVSGRAEMQLNNLNSQVVFFFVFVFFDTYKYTESSDIGGG